MRAGLAAIIALSACSGKGDPAPVTSVAATSADAVAAQPAQAPDACATQVARIRALGDGPLPGLEEVEYVATWHFDRALTFPGPVAGLRSASTPLYEHMLEIRANGRSEPGQIPANLAPPPVLYVAADASLTVEQLARRLSELPPAISSRLLIRRPPGEWVDKFLKAFPQTPPALADLFRREPTLGPWGPGLIWGEAVIAAAAGCGQALQAIGAMKNGGLAAAAPLLAEAYRTCSCRMADPYGLEALVIFTGPRSDLGWLPIRFSTDPGARDLGLGPETTVADLVRAMNKLTPAEQDRPIRWRGR